MIREYSTAQLHGVAGTFTTGEIAKPSKSQKSWITESLCTTSVFDLTMLEPYLNSQQPMEVRLHFLHVEFSVHIVDLTSLYLLSSGEVDTLDHR